MNRSFIKTFLKGFFKGIFYYILYYVIIFGLIVYYAIPMLIKSMNIEIDVSSMIQYSFINTYIIAWFITLHVITEFLRTYIPYGSALEPAIGIILLYIILSSLNYGRITREIPEYNASITIDASQLFLSLYTILVMFSIGSIFSRIASEYKHRHSRLEVKTKETG